MENFLSNFKNTNTEVTSNNANISISPEFWGTIDVIKGSLSVKLSFFARMYKTRYGSNLISLDDWDINEISDVSFGGMPIDCLDTLKTTMVNSGLKTVASSLEIDNKDYEKEICVQISKQKIFNSIFGKDAIMYNILSDKEKTNIKLTYLINNLNNIRINDHDLKDYLVKDEDGNNVKPTLEQLTEVYNKLNN